MFLCDITKGPGLINLVTAGLRSNHMLCRIGTGMSSHAQLASGSRQPHR